MEPKTMDKHIVSKGKYVQVQGVRVGLGFLSLCVVLCLIVCGLVALGFFCLGVFGFVTQLAGEQNNGESIARVIAIEIFCIVACVLSGSATCFLSKLLNTLNIYTLNYANIVPLTRANTADLPAPDSLVRASSEPEQTQQAVLLRAAAEGQETPPEQLVRASLEQK